MTKEKFGDAQIHVEFATPSDVSGDSQGRGNSGVYLQGRYELQVLDSYNNPTNAKGSCGAVYSKHAPLVNASRGPGEWQTFDIVFHAARFDASGKKTANARVTVLHNGVVVHNHQEIIGQMAHRIHKPFEPHAPQAPLVIQNHDVPVRYRSIWVRKLGTYDQTE